MIINDNNERSEKVKKHNQDYLQKLDIITSKRNLKKNSIKKL